MIRCDYCNEDADEIGQMDIDGNIDSVIFWSATYSTYVPFNFTVKELVPNLRKDFYCISCNRKFRKGLFKRKKHKFEGYDIKDEVNMESKL